jgi:hypothetical protein
MEQQLMAEGKGANEALRPRVAVECAILKVEGSALTT